MIRGKDISHDMVESLGHDMLEKPVFHAEKWREIKAERPGYADFIERRLTQLLGSDEQALRKCLALVVEVSALEEKAAFGDSMAELGLVPSQFSEIGNLAARDQLEVLDNVALTQGPLGTETAA